MNNNSTKKMSGSTGGWLRFVSGLAFAVLLLVSPAMKAQLSGTYTIGSGGNYSTFAAAVADLSSKGVSAAVTFNVSAATFNEAVSVPAITGASATNTITFQGAGRAKSFITSASNVITFNSCSYVTFTGFNITNSSSSYAIYANYCSNCTVSNCDIVCSTSSTYTIYDYYTYNFTIQNNHIKGGYECIYIYSSGGSTSYANNTYKNNKIVGFGYFAFYVFYSNNANYIGNTVDSSANGYGYGWYTFYETGPLYNSNIIIAPGLYEPFLIYYPNYTSYYSAGKTRQAQWINNYMSNYQDYAFYYFYYSNNCLVAHNTFYGTNYYPVYLECYYAVGNIQFISNNCISTNGSYAACYIYSYGSTWPAPFSEIDGNNYINTGGGPVMQGYNGSSFTYNTVKDWQASLASYTYTSPYNGTTNAYEAFAGSLADVFVKAPNNLRVDQTKPAASGVYAGVDLDIDGVTRCKLFPTAGCSESTYGKSKPTVKWFTPSNAFPNSPTWIYQTAKFGEPKAHQWYIYNSAYGTSTNYYKIPHNQAGDSLVLKTSLLTAGTNCIKLVTKSCGGNDSFSACFTVTAPTAVPATDFISNVNTIQAGQTVQFKDLSSNGPTKWQWSVTPDSIFSSGVKVPTVKYTYGNATSQNPYIQFNFGGKYKVCLTASNGVGKGSTVCKTNYINVIPSVNMGSTPVVHDAAGYLYDNGGPNGSYVHDNANGYVETMLIDPCADSVYLTFSLFDTYCGYDYVRLFEGRNNSGKNLTGKCATNGTFYSGGGGGFGFTGGKAYPGCTYQCMPNVVKPDTFKAKSTMWVEMSTYEGYNLGAGFAAYWWSKPKTSTKPTASFTSSNAGDSVCVNGQLSYTNTTKIDPNDPATFLWDLDGDITTFECVGTCASAAYPYFLPGNVKVTLIATNCGGSDTAIRTLTVYNPKAPVSQFSADNTTPTTNDVVFFTSTVPQCVDNYLWTISRSSGNTTAGKAVFLNGTSATAPNPQVNFTDTGYYDVVLYVDNASGANKNTKSITKYIHVRAAYCIPSVATINSGLGISKVVFNTISNKTTQATTDYTNYTSNTSLSTSIAIGASYNLTISRDASLIYEPINRTAYIDWNGDGSFVGKGEIVASDSNSYSADYTVKVTVPKFAKIGASVMRIATNRGSYSNKPCGQNEFGEYADYRVYITPYNILPVITLKGHQGLKDTIKLEQGAAFVDSGYKATSFLYGDITKSVVRTSRKLGSSNVADSFNALIPNIYVFSYNVTDSANNKAVTQYRIVQVTKDKTPPALKVAAPDTTLIEVTKTPIHPVPVPKVISADDLVDGPLAGSVVIDSGKVQTNIVGKYTVSYTVTDLSGNTSIAYRWVKVIDTLAPVIKLIGKSPVTVAVYHSYVEQGVSASDNYYTAGQLNPRIVITGNVDTSKVGTYTVSYNLTDPSNNKAVTVTRTVNVVDTLAPTISLNGTQTDSIAVFGNYSDPGVTVADNYSTGTDIKITVTGTFYSKFIGGKNANVIGSYTIIYTATDKSGNKSSVTRTVKVQDRTAPVLVLKGDAAVSVCRWFNYVDAGCTVTDNYDKPGTITPVAQGSFVTNGGTTMYGLLTLRYMGTDASGNVGYSDYRYIQVKPSTDWTCTSSIAQDLSLDKSINVYPNPNTGIFTINATLASQEKVRMSVTNMLGQEIAVIHNGVLSTNSFQVDLSNQANGIYLLNIVSGNQTVTKRIEIAK